MDMVAVGSGGPPGFYGCKNVPTVLPHGWSAWDEIAWEPPPASMIQGRYTGVLRGHFHQAKVSSGDA